MLLIKNLKLNIDDDISLLQKKISEKLKDNTKKWDYKIVKESIDARKKEIHFIYQVIVNNATYKKIYNKNKDIEEYISKIEENKFKFGEKKLIKRPVVIGLGPAGLFAGLTLARNGYQPIIYELGKNVEEREKDVDLFWNKGILNENSNVQFGEGGAGTFSDGKLTTRIKDPRVKNVLEDLKNFGGPEEIIYSHKAHIGTDILKIVVKNIRNEIIKLGGEINFESSLNDIEIIDGKLKSIKINEEKINADIVILAIGNSARKTFEMLYNKGISIIAKPFAVGFRIEHPRIEIDKSQYGELYNHPKLSSASYNLTCKTSNGRSCYTFCMCPGGYVVASSSIENTVVVNGMSYHSRDNVNSNSAILCGITTNDFGDNPLDGMKYQTEIEKKAFELGGNNYYAPVQKVCDFLENKKTLELGTVLPSYLPGYKLTNLNDIYSKEITDAIKESIIDYSKKITAFSMKDAVITGVETRTSSPIRIQRDDKYQSINCIGLYPAGEGAGYAGGIISSAVDGIKCAESIMKDFSNINF